MKIPVYIIHGSLGSGKTTILGKLLSHPSFSKSLIIENEFADYNFDSGMFENHGHGIEVRGISGGCICCSSSEELFTVLDQVGKDVPSVVIETSGVTNSMALVKKLIVSPQFNDKFEIVKNVMLVDLQTEPASLEGKKLDLLLSDIVVLNKKDLSSPDNITEFERIVEKYTNASIVIFDRDTDLEELVFNLLKIGVSNSQENLKMALLEGGLVDHQNELIYQVIYPTKEVEKDDLLNAIKKVDREGVRLLRVKGVFNSHTDGPTIVNGTFGNVEFEKAGREMELGIVFIGEGITRLALADIEKLLK